MDSQNSSGRWKTTLFGKESSKNKRIIGALNACNTVSPHKMALGSGSLTAAFFISFTINSTSKFSQEMMSHQNQSFLVKTAEKMLSNTPI
ncbi:hypothetical protein [Vibrio natriegens]|uniref:Uncharacterized protein n=1 Tax=Vibrio natriegens NBRC 15636 = ATCC 14048 = DSM 759 TaxID=1219067 RepID=A0AAN0Y001_VIBNA|nr:hypothetical protein [Vibrio natriegens]ALR16808.1 hypothetical protein PN96_12810 [Vibrio natriegens NBRC 15636 = ATCC 14048 = DSM 759]ANQ11326.1 hypothetical protein BA890_00520 [Vibrio natriegens NBRC 15636 = ATCC 14048 = DSM 759]EPM38536.1 hypothetical protein M272_04295 [Vibrio natriegens NBRC 15636 = ATCC 14048 = DSM 759]MDX6025650.1 hypothetical protein [Vibrio natriegens NBRC 15636 = ATCC 14048 = DSM 759]UUI11770.1 hypothetical protein NP431_00510 [Vibrio natriegens]